MPKLEEIKAVVKKIASVEELNEHICFFGGSIPYLQYNEESNRNHSDIDILVDEEKMETIRELLKSYDLYKPELDSLNLDLDKDYGLKAFINGVYVEFEPMTMDNGLFTRASFSPEKELAGVESIPYEHREDIIIPLEIDGIHTYSQSMEMIMLSKEKYKREIDLKDMAFIMKHGIDTDKYDRVKTAMENYDVDVASYEVLREKGKLK